MPQSERQKDIISEQEFNKQMRNVSSTPKNDSPGDSEQDTGTEYMMGVNFTPDAVTGTSHFDEVGEIIYADDKSTAPSETPSDINQSTDDPEAKLPPTARVISSQKPSPSADMHKRSDTN